MNKKCAVKPTEVYLYIGLLKHAFRVAASWRLNTGCPQEERSIFWEVIVSVILSKNVYMNMCPITNGFRDRAIWMYNRKIVDKKEILRVRTVSNTGIYCSSDRVGTVYNKCSKIPPSTSMHFATRVKIWRVVRLSASWRSFMQAITSSMLTSSSFRGSTFFSVHFTLH